MRTNLFPRIALTGIMLVGFSLCQNTFAAKTVLQTDDADCYIPTYSDRANLVQNPTCNSLDGFGGWGGKSVNTDIAYVYCGISSILVNSSWGGTLEITGLSANTVYRFIAKTYVPTGAQAKFAWYGHGLGEGDVNLFFSSQGGIWQTADFTFKTGEAGGGVYYVSESGGNVYIDNYEVYAVQEPQITIKYQDAEGNMLKDDRIVQSTWGTTPADFLTIGKNYAAAISDKAEIEKEGDVYHYDIHSTTDYVSIAEGNNVITLKFAKEVELSDNSDLAGLSVAGSNLHPAFDPSIFTYTVKLPAGTTSVTPVVTKAEAAQAISGGGAVDVTSGGGSSVIVVTSEDNSSSKTYTIDYTTTPSDDTFIPVYSDKTNLVPNPYCNSLEGFGGWGTKSVNSNPDYIYCGSNSISVGGNFSGTFEITGLSANTVYRFIAKTYAPTGAVNKFCWYGHNLGGGDVKLSSSSQTNVWETADFTFKTGESGGGVYYVSESGGNVYIDNYEVYAVQEPQVTIKYQDTEGSTLQEDNIVQSAWGTNPADFLTIGKIYTATISDKAGIAKGGDIYRYDTDNSTDNVLVAEGDNVIILKFAKEIALSDNSDLASLSVTGSNLHPAFDPAIFTYTVKLPAETASVIPVVTKAELAQEISGDEPIDVTSGEGSSVIVVTSEDNSSSKTYTINYTVTPSDDTFIPVYSDRVILTPSPYCNSLDGFGGWGTKSVNSNPDYIYSGSNSISVGGNFSGTLEITGLLANTVYRFIAKTYAPTGAQSKFAWYGHGLGGGDMNLLLSSEENTWETADFTFKTGASGGGVYYVSESGGNVYIDNYEVYVVQEPQITIKYQDAEGNTLKEDQVIMSEWGVNPVGYFMIGGSYTVDDSEKETFVNNGKSYVYDEASSVDNVIIEEGDNTITLLFSAGPGTGNPNISSKSNLEIISTANGATIQSDEDVLIAVFTTDGKLVKTVQIKEGATDLPLPRGQYIIDGNVFIVE